MILDCQGSTLAIESLSRPISLFLLNYSLSQWTFLLHHWHHCTFSSNRFFTSVPQLGPWTLYYLRLATPGFLPSHTTSSYCFFLFPASPSLKGDKKAVGDGWIPSFCPSELLYFQDIFFFNWKGCCTIQLIGLVMSQLLSSVSSLTPPILINSFWSLPFIHIPLPSLSL